MKDLTNGREGRLIFQFATPMLLGNAFQVIYNLVDTVIVGNFLGKEALSAVGNAFPLLFVLLSLIIGFAMGATILISQFFGSKQYDKVRQTIETLYIVLFFTSITVSIAGIMFSNSIFRLIDLPEDIIPKATAYFDIILAGIIGMFGFNGTSAILRGLGDSKTPLYFLIISTVVNIGLDLLFVTVFHFGIQGVAIATVIAQMTAFLAAVFYLNRHHQIIQISLHKMHFYKDVFMKSFRIGLPTGMQQMFVALGMTALMWIVNLHGTNAIAAYAVAARIDSFAMLPAMNFSAALSAFVGQNIGAKKYNRVTRGLKSTLLMTSTISVSITIIYFIFGEYLLQAFTPEAKVIAIGESYLYIVGASYLLFSTMFCFYAVFRGAGDTLMPMFFTLISLWIVRLPVAYILSQSMGTDGIWYSTPISWFVGVLFAISYYYTGRWKTKKIIS